MDAGNDAEASLREEKRQFRKACISAGLVMLVYAVVPIFEWWNDGKIAAMTAAGASPQEIHQQKLSSMIAMEYGGVVVLFCGLVFVRCFLKWLFAIRRRRRERAGLPPAALP